MKVRDSGMPDEEMWAGFFEPEEILRRGCGYGTFTIPAARLVSGTMHALDIDQEMISVVRNKCRENAMHNVDLRLRDFVAEGSGLADESQDAALLFNILHHEEPEALMREARRILKPGGIMAVIHWNHDPATPRGPALEIRRKPEQCITWGATAGFRLEEVKRFDLPPYHYGLLFRKYHGTE